jgi:multiple sugar transport system permease protein
MLLPPTFVGLGNYTEILTFDSLFVKVLGNTVYFVFLSVPMGIVVALAMAILLNQKVIARPFFRTCFYVPSLVTGVSVAVLWSWLLNPQFGMINHFLSLFGVVGPEWLYNTTTAMPAMIIMSLWGVGGSMVIYLAGLQGIPEQYYEAAEIDGAGAWKKFLNITIPMVTPTIFFNLIMGVIGAFQSFAQFFIMTNGGPANATLTYVLYLYRNAFEYFRMGYAAALAWILFLIILGATALQFWGSRHWVYYEGELR